MKAPDFDALQAINAELEKLDDEGHLSRNEYEKLLTRAKEAVGQRTEFLEGILMQGMRHGFVKP